MMREGSEWKLRFAFPVISRVGRHTLASHF